MLVPLVVQVQYNPDVTGPRHLIAAVEDAGFDAEAISIDRWALLLGASCTALRTLYRQAGCSRALCWQHWFDQGAPSHGTALVTGSLGSSAASWSHLVPEGQHWCTRQSAPSWIRCLLPSSCRSRTRPHIQGWGAGEAPGNNWTPS